MPSKMIEVRELVKEFGYRDTTLAVDNVTLSVEKGAVFGLLGPKGAGKTTTLRILATTLGPTSGSVEIEGRDIRTETGKVRELLGWAPADIDLHGWATGTDYLNFWGRVSGLPRSERRGRTGEILSFLEMDEDATQDPAQLPVGMQRRLNLGQALMTRPEVLILDEPMAGLDPEERSLFLRKLQDLKRQGKTIVLSSQVLSEVQQSSDLVSVMFQGRTTPVQELSALLRKLGEGKHARLFLEAENLTPEVISSLEALDGVTEVRPMATAIVVYLEPGKIDGEGIRATVEANGVKVQGIREAEITLGDVFRAIEFGSNA